MGQKLRDDKIGTLSQAGGIITMAASSVLPAWLTIGGQQYKITSNLIRSIATDVTMTANTAYFVYAVYSAGSVQLRISANTDDIGPSGFTSWKLLSSYTSNASSSFGAFASSATRTDSSPIGMIIPSMLTEAQFQALNGTSWVLAQGQTATGTAYASITGQSTIPDLRGMFLRGKNNGRVDGNQDSGGERALGSFQSDALQNINATWQSGTANASNTSGAVTATAGSASDPQGTGRAHGIFTFDAANVARTATETRSRNIAVNYFIKVNP